LASALTIFRDACIVYKKYVYDEYAKGDEEEIEDNRQYFVLLIRKHLNRLFNLKGKNAYLCGS